MSTLEHAVEHVSLQQKHRISWQETDSAERIVSMIGEETEELEQAVKESFITGDVFSVASEIADVLYLAVRLCQELGFNPADLLDMKTKRNSMKYSDAVCNNGYSPAEATLISKEGWKAMGGDEAFSLAYLLVLADVE